MRVCGVLCVIVCSSLQTSYKGHSMGSITEAKKVDAKTGKTIKTYRAFIRRAGYESKSKVFESKSKAEDWLRNNEGDRELVRRTNGHGKTFRDVVDAFIQAPPVRGTKYRAESHIDFWLSEFGLVRITRITRKDINESIDKLQKKPAMLGVPGGSKTMDRIVTPGTINRYLATLSSIFNYALNHEIIDSHPMKGGKVKKLEESKGRTRILTSEEEQLLYKAAEGSSWPMMRLFLRMLLTTASRKSEIKKLRWRDVNFDLSAAIITKTKGKEPRALPLVADVLADLKVAKQARPLDAEYVFFDPLHHERAKNVDSVWFAIRKEAGLWKDREDPLDRVCMHTTRHTAATKMLRKGANIAQAAKVTGHKTLAMLNRYTHLSTQDSVDLAQSLLAE